MTPSRWGSGAPPGIEAIVIGTSAGGIDALSRLLPALPADARLAVFVVVHLPPAQPSLLTEIFQPRCALRVQEAEDKQRVEPGTLYFAPPDYHLLLDAGPQLALSADPPVHFSRPSIDALFESAADVYGKALLGIVLTGASEDGANGLLAIHQAGGATLVQRPSDAATPAMPLYAIQRCPAARVLGLEDMGMLLQDASVLSRR